jgi:HlyD family secretion protein
LGANKGPARVRDASAPAANGLAADQTERRAAPPELRWVKADGSQVRFKTPMAKDAPNLPPSAPTASPTDARAPQLAAPGASAPRRRSSPLAWIAVGAAALALGGAGAWWFFGRAPQAHYVTTAASRGAVTRSVTASGTVNPQLTVLVGAYVSGTITDISCDFNTRVRRGQICARIDPRPYQMQVDQDAAALATAKAQLVKDGAALQYAEAADRRDQILWAQNSIAKDAAELAHSNAAQAGAQVGLDEASVKQHAAALEAANINLQYTNIASPVDGTVVSRNVTQGQTVASSFQTPTLFLIATDLTRMQVDANVSEGDVGGLRAGDRATFTVDAYPQRTFRAVLTQVRQAPQTVQNVVTYDVVLTVGNADLALMPGMTATAKIVSAQRGGVLRVPNQALRFQPGGLVAAGRSAGGGAHLWVLRQSRPVRVAVTTGLSDDSFTEITSGVLKAGDLVITGQTASAPKGAARAPAFRF